MMAWRVNALDIGRPMQSFVEFSSFDDLFRRVYGNIFVINDRGITETTDFTLMLDQRDDPRFKLLIDPAYLHLLTPSVSRDLRRKAAEMQGIAGPGEYR